MHLAGNRGHAVAQVFDVRRYKPEGRGFDSIRNHWNYLLTKYFRLPCVPGVNSALKRNECQGYLLQDKGSQCVELTTLPSLCA